jgi:starch-binding outer membrane protein, SusD/RagB family
MMTNGRENGTTNLATSILSRLAEMYLTRAEANFRLGTAVGATPEDDVNLIRERVNLDPIVGITLDQILLERHLELAFEGHLLHDLKRTQSDIGGVPFNDPSLIYPIPQRERIINPDLQQNAGYGN